MSRKQIITAYKEGVQIAGILIGGLGGFGLLRSSGGIIIGTVFGIVIGKWLRNQIVRDEKNRP